MSIALISRCTRTLRAGVITVLTLAVSTALPLAAPAAARADTLSLCGNAGPAPAVSHVIVVMLENLSYGQVVGSSNSPYQTSLASTCGVAKDYFGATHSSAANYFAVSGAQYPANSPSGCGAISQCATTQDNVYRQLESAGSTWHGYMESMPSNCYPKSSGTNTGAHALYSVGHNPIVFYKNISSADCQANDVAVNDLTANSGQFYNDLQNQTLPAFSMVVPNTVHNGQGPSSKAQNQQTADTWLQNFVGFLKSSPSYQAGNTMLLVTYDEGGQYADEKIGENCTNQSADLPLNASGQSPQESCHIPTFVVYPYAAGGDTTFFTHYSITRTVEDLFGLPYLANASSANSLVGHLGIPARTTSTPPTVAITAPSPGSTVSGQLTVSGTAASTTSSVSGVQVSIDGGTSVTATGTTNWNATLDTTALSNGTHTLTATATDATGASGSSSEQITVNNPVTPTPPTVAITAPASGATVSGPVTVTGTAGSASSSVTSVQVSVDGGAAVTASGTANWSSSFDSTALGDGSHTLTATATDATGATGTATETITVNNSAPPPTPPTVAISSPASGSTVVGQLTVSGTAASSSSSVSKVQVSVDGGAAVTASGTTNWSTTLDTTTLSNGTHTLTATATDAGGATGTTSETVTVNNAPASACPAPPSGSAELSGNVSLESAQTGWTGVYNATTSVTRVQPSGGSFDGTWALRVAPTSGKSGAAGVNNASPVWVTNTTAGRKYTASAYLNPSVAGEKITMLVRETTASGAAVSYASTTITATTGWQRLTASYTARNSGDNVRVSVYATNFASSSQNFLADCMSLWAPTA